MKRSWDVGWRWAAAFLLAYVLVAVLTAPRNAGKIPSFPEPGPAFRALPDRAVLAAPVPPALPAPTPPLPPQPKIPVVLPRHAAGGALERPPVQGVVLAADRPDHYHDEFVALTLRAETADMMDLLRSTGPYVAWIEEDGRRVTTVGDKKETRLRFDSKQGLYMARWPVPWNAPDGEYQPRLAASPWPEGLPPPKFKPFRVMSRPFEPVPLGFAVLTLEGYRSLDRIPGPDGVKSIQGMPAWARFIGANALFITGGESSGFDHKPPDDFPWTTASFTKMRALGQECHRWGLKLGVYVLSYMVGGPPVLSANYAYGWNFDERGLRPGLSLVTRRGISITDPKRPGDIANMLRRLQAMPEVDWLGMDYIRPAFGSCELVDDFVAEMPDVQTPAGYSTMTPEQRMTWLCRGRYSAPTPERRLEPRFILSDQWFWYRAHRTAEVVRSIIQALGHSKPIWAYTLSWNKGWEHGQDPCMMRDAGIDLDAVMLYEADEMMFRGLVSHWGSYARRDQFDVIVGDQTDWVLHQKTLIPSGPESYVDRLLRAARGFSTDRKPARGFFIHDIHRMLTNGKRMGPYKTMEWMTAAGYAISELRRMHGILPYDVSLAVSTSTAPGEVLTATVAFRGAAPAGNVTVRFFGAPDLEVSTQEATLSARTPSAAVRVRWTPIPISARRANRTFLALRASRPDKPEESPVFQETYIQGRVRSAAPAKEEEDGEDSEETVQPSAASQ